MGRQDTIKALISRWTKDLIERLERDTDEEILMKAYYTFHPSPVFSSRTELTEAEVEETLRQVERFNTTLLHETIRKEVDFRD